MKAVKDANTKEIFETMPVPNALLKMAIPTITSQLIALVYNIADTWFIAQTDNPYMVAASSLVLTMFFMVIALSNLFGTGGGTLAVRLMGSGQEDEARKAASLSVVLAGCSALAFSTLCGVFMEPLLDVLGASENTVVYARQYLLFVVVLGGVPAVLSNTMSAMVRNTGHSKEAAFGLSMGGVLNVILDPILMFVILPDGYEVAGAALATMISNYVSLIYFIRIYIKLKDSSILEIPRRVERIKKSSLRSMFSVGIPAATSVLLFDITNILINRLSASHGDIELAAVGLVLKVERLPLNIGIGICLGMVPLLAYNYASGNHKRMYEFFGAARISGLCVAFCSVALYFLSAPYIMEFVIDNEETVYLGTKFLRARCFATPFMFMSFHMVHFMQAVNRGRVALILAVIRQLCLNIPILFLLNHFFGMMGIVWTQATADMFNVIASYIIYMRVKASIKEKAVV